MACAVGQNRFEPIKLAAVDVRFFVQYNSCRMLLHSLPHHPGFPMVRMKTFLDQNGSHRHFEAVNLPRKILTTGKQQVIGITRIIRSSRSR